MNFPQKISVSPVNPLTPARLNQSKHQHKERGASCSLLLVTREQDSANPLESYQIYIDLNWASHL
jgi:hypothetical protein